MERTSDHTVTITLDGGDTYTARLSLVRKNRRKLSKSRLATIGGDVLRPLAVSDDRVDFRVPANGHIALRWE